jgi:hypothetical protein
MQMNNGKYENKQLFSKRAWWNVIANYYPKKTTAPYNTISMDMG